jgi:5-methyltetrahydropteroyltriglutamate--homocysteine methyltransferase
MKFSADRILTTHVGSMPRPADIREMMRSQQSGQPFDQRAFARRVRSAVAEVVRRQVECGIDIVNDGEQSKTSFSAYAYDRLTGFEPPEVAPNIPSQQTRRDRLVFPEYYDEYQRTLPPAAAPVVCTGPISYRGQALVKMDIEHLKSALQEVQVEEAFVPAIAPGSFARFQNQYYATEEAFLFAIAEAMKEEYKAIVDAGFILQIDDPGLPDTWDMLNPALTIPEYRKFAALRVEAINHALAGLPEDRIRYHICWGSWQGPHVTDIPLKDVVDLLLQVRAQGYSVEAANPRHAYEWHIWEDTKLPEGKVLIPGVIAHTTAVVEHPETVADRIMNFAGVVGRERVIAGADCGFAQGAFLRRQHPTIMWAKFQALAEGARLASKKLWGHR